VLWTSLRCAVIEGLSPVASRVGESPRMRESSRNRQQITTSVTALLPRKGSQSVSIQISHH
jgi:hypothetical protein